MIAQLHINDWWWLQDVFGVAQVVALVGVAVAVCHLAQEIRSQVRVVVKPDRKAGTAAVSITNRALLDPPLIRLVWAVPKNEASQHHDRSRRCA